MLKGRGVMIFWVVIGLLIIGGFGATAYMKTLPGKYDGLAQCLTEEIVWQFRRASAVRRMFESGRQDTDANLYRQADPAVSDLGIC
jgi:hypothetical protein